MGLVEWIGNREVVAACAPRWAADLGRMAVSACSAGLLGCSTGLILAPAGHVVFTADLAPKPPASTTASAANATSDSNDGLDVSTAGTTEAPETTTAAAAVAQPAREVPRNTLQGSVGAGVDGIQTSEGNHYAVLGVLGEYGRQLGLSRRGRSRGELVVDGGFGSSLREGEDNDGWNAVLRVGWRARVHRRLTVGAGVDASYRSLYSPVEYESSEGETGTIRGGALAGAVDLELATGGGKGRYEWSLVERLGPSVFQGGDFLFASMTTVNQALVLGPRRRVVFPLGVSALLLSAGDGVFAVFGGIGFMGSLK